MSDKFIIIEFRIHYNTQQGEEIYILGDNDDFGNWTSKKFKLDWNENNIWKKEYKMPTNNKNIKYKFVCAHLNTNDKNNFKWEECPNRILSVENLKNLRQENEKYILEQIWNHFTVNCTLHYQAKSPNDSIFILGSDPALGDWGKNDKNNYKMELEKNDKNNNVVYKKKFNIKIEDKNKKEMELEYKYMINNDFEKGMNRHVHILFNMDEINDEVKFFYLTNPKEYKLLTNSIIEIEDTFID